MRFSFIILAIIATYFVIVPQTFCAEEDNELKVTSIEAWSIAQRYAGLHFMEGASDSIIAKYTDLIRVPEDKTPFLSEQIVNKPVWEVRVGEAIWSKEFIGFGNERDSLPHGLIVWISGVTGQFLKGFTLYGKYAFDLCPEPPADSATKQLTPKEVWIGFAESVPQATLFKAIYPTPQTRPHYAKELIIHLVKRQSADPNGYELIWSILARGLTGGGPTHGHNVHPCVDNRMRMIVDATTGKMMTIYMGFPHLLNDDLE